MARRLRSLKFWTLLLVSVVLPATLLATKQLYQTNVMTPTGAGAGNSIITVINAQYEYSARSFGAAAPYSVKEVVLNPANYSWQVVLCTNLNAAPEDDCTYDTSGNLDIDGAITPSMLIAAGATGAQFSSELKNANLTVEYHDASGNLIGSGTYIRIF